MNLKLRVYYADTDCGGVVYYANYLKYMEAGRMEFMREKGVDLTTWHGRGVLFVVVETNVKYRSSGRLDDMLEIRTTLLDRASITLTFNTEIVNQNGVLLVTAQTKLACLNDSGKASRIPIEMLEAVGRVSAGSK